MNKLKIALAVAGIVVLAGCGSKPADNQSQSATPSAPTTSDNSSASTGGAISSIKDAIASGQEMKCTYTTKNPDGNSLQSTTYVSGTKYRSEMMIADKTQYVIFDGDAMYSWMEGQTQGMKMTMACAQDMAKNLPQGQENAPQTPDPTGEKTFDSATDVSCTPTSGTDFSVPTSVTFMDQCENIKKMTESFKNPAAAGSLPKDMPPLPEGVTIPQQ